MVIKKESILERLKRLEEVIEELEHCRGQPLDAFCKEVQRQWIVERGFILAAECVADIAGHILSGRFKVQPADHEDAIRRLAEKGVISSALAAELRGLAGFRNILIHEYLRIDPVRVHQYLESRLGELDDFIAQITEWLDR